METMPRQNPPVSPISLALGGLAMAFGVFLTGLTISGAIDGFAAIGFYDIMIGGMIISFGLRSVTFGHAVVYGRLTITGQVVV
jgi:hypothetical protein